MAASTVNCLNCGQPAGPAFCGHCGQAITARRSPLLSLLRELLEEWLSVDGRAIRTFRTLLHPGRLTRHYLDGKRAPYLPPFRLYLLSSVILFSSALTLDPPDARTITLDIAGVRMTEAPSGRGRVSLDLVDANSFVARVIRTRYASKFAQLQALPPQKFVDELFTGLRGVLPIALIAFVPLLSLALKLLYVRRHVLYVDHLVFGVHFQSALFLAMGATWIVTRVLRAGAALSIVSHIVVFLFMVTFYLARSLAGVYGERRMMRWGKTAALFFAYKQAMEWVVGPALLFVMSRM